MLQRPPHPQPVRKPVRSLPPALAWTRSRSRLTPLISEVATPSVERGGQPRSGSTPVLTTLIGVPAAYALTWSKISVNCSSYSSRVT